MKKLKWIFLSLMALPFLSSCGYNSMIELSEGVDAQWAQVENVYQRRSDLIPNLVNTVKGYANHEEGTLTAVVEARSKALSVNVDASKLDAQSIQKFQEAQSGLTQALSKLMVLQENYPDLKANQNFMDLQAQLEGTENRITVERQKFNDITRQYNTYIKRFPKNLIAMMFNFEQKPYFQAEAGANQAPKVEF